MMRDAGASADEWLVLGRRLSFECRRLASARYCLHEWPEPDDAERDADDIGAGAGAPAPPWLRALRAGRRNVRLWREPG